MTETPTTAWLLTAAAYAAGATPVSYWIGLAFYNKDLRRLGSGNLGATNAYRMLSPAAGAAVVVLDAFKGFAPAWWFPIWDGQEAAWWAVVYGGAAVVGHLFSFWVRFRGGKGVATSAGVLGALSPAALAAAFGVWLLVAVVTRIVSLASIAAALTLPLVASLLSGADPVVRGFLALAGLFVAWAHRSNIRRLRDGTEHRMGRKQGKAEQDAGGVADAGRST